MGNWRPITSLAPGLLGSMGMKNTGRNPDEMIGSVQPILDVMPFYDLGSVKNLDATVTITASPQAPALVPDLVVPEGKIWVVTGGMLFAGVAAAAVASFSARLTAGAPGLTGTDVALTDRIVVGDPTTAAAAFIAAASISAAVTRRILLPAGFRIFPLVEWWHGAGAVVLTARVTVAEYSQ